MAGSWQSLASTVTASTGPPFRCPTWALDCVPGRTSCTMVKASSSFAGLILTATARKTTCSCSWGCRVMWQTGVAVRIGRETCSVSRDGWVAVDVKVTPMCSSRYGPSVLLRATLRASDCRDQRIAGGSSHFRCCLCFLASFVQLRPMPLLIFAPEIPQRPSVRHHRVARDTISC